MTQSKHIGDKEFIALMAVLMSLLALAIDAMLPALGQIGESFSLTDPNQVQWIITGVFLGMALGLMIYGPLSDAFGRKNVFYIGIGIFLIGDLISLCATDFNTMVIGRVLQGFGAASCRVLTTAMVRDKYQGREMARVMSLMMMLFITVPVLAPSLGQLVLVFFAWPAIFTVLFLIAATAALWLYFRQPETHPAHKRQAFSLVNIRMAIGETLTNADSRSCMLASALVFSAFVGYLSSAQQILQIQYQLGDSFAIAFGALALSMGVSSYINSRLVMIFKLETLCRVSLSAITTLSLLCYVYLILIESEPPLTILLIYLSLVFFFMGTLFGNLNALALKPLGHIAGTATSCISSLQTLISIFIGSIIGQAYQGSVQPLILGFLFTSALALIILLIRAKNIK